MAEALSRSLRGHGHLGPKPAPEYQMGWADKAAAGESLERILAWDFERVELAHGDRIEADVKTRLREAWSRPLAG